MVNELAWGGYQNGQIPLEARAVVPFATAQSGHPIAVAALVRLNEAFRGRFGYNIAITDSYRSYARQVQTYNDKGPGIAAKPGTSNHGWGRALDLGSEINYFGTAQHLWMQANAPAYGWIHPYWARQGGGRQEPWHWEFPDLNHINTNSGGFLMALTDAQQQQMYEALLGVNGAASMQAMMPFGQNLPTSVAATREALQTLLDRSTPVSRINEGSGAVEQISLRQEIADAKTNTIAIKKKLGA